jgi:hypothetical protein
MNGEKVGRTSGFRGMGLTWRIRKRKVAPVRRRKPAEPRRTAARRVEGKPEARPQGGAEGGREKAARLDRGSAQSSVGSSRSERVAVFGKDGPCYGTVTSLEPPDLARAGIVRHDPGAASAGRLRRGPEEHGRLRPNGYSGLRRVWTYVAFGPTPRRLGDEADQAMAVATRPPPASTTWRAACPGPPDGTVRPGRAKGRRDG